ncbi:2-hydroxycarboxylate transporter family protein [Mycoavidus sp. B2-EB]|uniref:2-hydroxycarboxylate transporter family protein n=1 Tax=Mycoavidus sp. B2-EB TaxID=2651972 RepID=UPI001628A6BC|nr:2-hydroxycarboxylate transporter family protein [Mycoavidus sp. B2-EB]BBO60528.1 citrate-sodium symporter [Mycoavidus sp. B2-EB]
MNKSQAILFKELVFKRYTDYFSLKTLQTLSRKSIGIIPLPVYLVLVACLATMVLNHQLMGNNICTMIALLAVCGYTCSAIGQSIPFFRRIGGSVIIVTFVPAYLVAHQLLPADFVLPIQAFWENNHPIYLFIVAVIVGSVLSMDRQVLIQGFIKIFAPLLIGSIVAAIIGTLVGLAVGFDLFHIIFFIIVPIMAGGLGEGAIPLSIGYAKILGHPQGDLLAQILPAIIFANLFVIILAAALNLLGRHYPRFSGDGCLLKADREKDDTVNAESSHENVRPLLTDVATTGMTAISFYLIGVLTHQLFGWPAPIAMLLIAILVKLLNLVSPAMHQGAVGLYHFFVKVTIYPLLFAAGMTIIPWDKLAAAFNLPFIVTVFATVISLMATGFFVGRKVGLFPIEAAIVTGCHSGMGGSGDIAILSAAHRLSLMPFAQISTRIGGVIVVIIALLTIGFLN